MIEYRRSKYLAKRNIVYMDTCKFIYKLIIIFVGVVLRSLDCPDHFNYDVDVIIRHFFASAAIYATSCAIWVLPTDKQVTTNDDHISELSPIFH